MIPVVTADNAEREMFVPGKSLICEINIPNHVMTLPAGFKEIYFLDVPQVCGVPETLLDGMLIQAGSKAAYISMFDDIYGDKSEGDAFVSFLACDGETYIRTYIRWMKIVDDGTHVLKAVCLMEPVAEPEEASLSVKERQELIELRAKVELQEEYLERSKNYQKELRRYRHDGKNNLIAISGLINNNDIEGAKKYIKELGTILSLDSAIINTGNPGVDSLLSEKIEEARKKKIEVEHIVGLAPGLGINTRDLCLAVGSCLDNAIEACMLAHERYTRIVVSFQLIEKHGMITFKMENTSITPQQPAEKTMATSKQES